MPALGRVSSDGESLAVGAGRNDEDDVLEM
jgi:hypothetical protein